MSDADLKTDEPREDRAKPGSFRARSLALQRATLHSAARYSIFVRVMKGALPVAALGLGIAVLAYALQPREPARVALTFGRVGEVKGDLAMQNPKLTGTDDNGLPFTITAASASQVERGSNSVRLTEVTADFTTKEGTSVRVTARQGTIDTEQRLFDISGGIHLVSSDGYDVRTEAAHADLNAGTVHGETRVEADGAFGHIGADRFAFNNKTRKLQFNGNVKMLLRKATR